MNKKQTMIMGTSATLAAVLFTIAVLPSSVDSFNVNTSAETMLIGHATIVHKDINGNILRVAEADNIITTVGKNAVTNTLFNTGTTPSFTHVAIGNGPAPVVPVVGGTTLVAEIDRLQDTDGAANIAGNIATLDVSYLIDLDGGDPAIASTTLSEVGLFDAAAAGTMISHLALSPTITVNDGDTVDITYTVTVQP